MKLLVRADAGATVGIGHVMRCLALAQAWQDAGGEVLFLSADMQANLRGRLTGERIALSDLDAASGGPADAAQTAELARRSGASWIVVDGYQFSATYQHAVKSAGHRLLWIDDLARDAPYTADLILNQSEDADEAMYPDRAATTLLLLGTQFVLLRREFHRWLEWRRPPAGSSRKILVTMGGADEANVTAKAVEALSQIEGSDVETRVIIGPSNPNRAAIESVAGGLGWLRVESAVADMPALMAWADIAVTAGGTTCWELAFMQLPFVAVAVAPNQIRGVERVEEIGIGLSLGWHSEVTGPDLATAVAGLLEDRDRRDRMAARGRQVVDGGGARRVVDRMLQSDRAGVEEGRG